MFKLLLCIVFIMSSTVVGFAYSNKLYKRKSTLEDFVVALTNCSTQMRYTSHSLSKIFADSFIEYSFCDNKPFAPQWTDMLKDYSNILTRDDISLLSNFSHTLGTCDTLGELSNIDMYIELIRKNISDAQNDIEQKSKLYKTLGLSLGLVVSILII